MKNRRGIGGFRLEWLRARFQQPARRLAKDFFSDCLGEGPHRLRPLGPGQWLLEFRQRGVRFGVRFRLEREGLRRLLAENFMFEALEIRLPAISEPEVLTFCQQVLFLAQPYGGLLVLDGDLLRWEYPAHQPGPALNGLIHTLSLHLPSEGSVCAAE